MRLHPASRSRASHAGQGAGRSPCLHATTTTVWLPPGQSADSGRVQGGASGRKPTPIERSIASAPS
jgi:hypothetical protein